ncbi:D-ribose ABC transporter substrate-binding protein [Georgenia sp. TF02-10]|uniref:D-ribose ABC transporter substrate-binding protein n=1 Tax=Georgenia sp. TF02-10 TaxID=2917725 RepID=UPI001FA769ED|nr:D-ribose ABC transporter substrate-binding protein [Georgenia sp. TF02-10]UNX54229.1 D-ribose ABC transporter substrate-binding protein [Georgenia sp. TF02-10]
MKKPVISLAALLAAGTLALSACGSDDPGSSNESPGGGGGGDDYSLGLAVSTLNNPFFVSLRDGAQDAADEAGVELIVTDGRDDATQQADQVANFQTQQLDAVLINPVDSDAAGPIVAPLVQSDVPVIAVDRAVNGAEVSTLVASDNVEGGRLAAQALAEAIGEEGQVIVLQGVAGTSASRERGQGFDEGIADYPNIEVVAKQPADFDRAQGLDVATNLLQANPDVVGIFAENDEMALGAVQALGDRAGQDVFVVGFDATEDGQAAVEAGTMFATIAQQPEDLGRAAVEAALDLLDGEDVEETISVPVVAVRQGDV